MKVKKVLIFTRPWEVRFHLALANELALTLDVDVEFATFFSKARWIIENKSNRMHKVYYMPELLQSADLSKWNQEYFETMDCRMSKIIGANFNMMLLAERFLPQKQKDIELFYKRHFLVLDSIISDGTLTMTSFIDHFVYWIASGIAWSKGGCHFGSCTIGMPANYTTYYKNPFEIWKKNVSMDYTDDILREAIEKLNIPMRKRVDYAIKTPRPGIIRRFKHTLNEIKFEKIDASYGSYFQFYSPINSRLFGHIKHFFKKLLPKDRLNFGITSKEQLTFDYIYYPLHYEPEATIMMLSPWYKDQLEITRLVAQALPVGMKLVVKDHPQMYTIRDSSYYVKLKSIPNVVLCSPTIEGPVLTRNCVGLVSISGTAAVEAAMLGKHTICYGNPPFKDTLECVHVANGFKQTQLHALFIKWRNDKRVMVNHEGWHKWASSLCKTSVVPKNNGFEYEIIPEEQRVCTILQHILDCLKYENFI